jgi:error-prone DNA polymerase
MLEDTPSGGYFCNVCSHLWGEVRSSVARCAELSGSSTTQIGSRTPDPGSRREADPRHDARQRYSSIDDLIAKTGVRRDELTTLAAIGALNAFGYDRRSALWQIEKAIRPAGELFDETAEHTAARRGGDSSEERSSMPRGVDSARSDTGPRIPGSERPPSAERRAPDPGPRCDSPLRPMLPSERLLADYAGTSLTIGPHPMAMRRAELALRGVLRASDLPAGRHGRRVRVAGAVITRQRPGTAKGFVFLTLEDETGIANVIVRPDLFSDQRAAIVGAPYLIVEGMLQIQEGVTSVKAERVVPLTGGEPTLDSHDFR